MSKPIKEPTDLEVATAFRHSAVGLRKWLAEDRDAALKAVLRGNPLASVISLLDIASMFAQRAGTSEQVNDVIIEFILEQQKIITRLEAGGTPDE